MADLITCPFCLDPWVALGLALGHQVAPRPASAVTHLFATVAGADLLQILQGRAQGE